MLGPAAPDPGSSPQRVCCMLWRCRYKDAGGKSMETLEAVKHSKATLEAQLGTQRSLIESMRSELAGAKVRMGPLDCGAAGGAARLATQ